MFTFTKEGLVKLSKTNNSHKFYGKFYCMRNKIKIIRVPDKNHVNLCYIIS